MSGAVRRVAAHLGFLLAVLAGSGMRPAIAATCPGDCSATGFVRAADLVGLVRVATGQQPTSACPAGDADGDGQISENEIDAAIGSLFAGCTEPPMGYDVLGGERFEIVYPVRLKSSCPQHWPRGLQPPCGSAIQTSCSLSWVRVSKSLASWRSCS